MRYQRKPALNSEMEVRRCLKYITAVFCRARWQNEYAQL